MGYQALQQELALAHDSNLPSRLRIRSSSASSTLKEALAVAPHPCRLRDLQSAATRALYGQDACNNVALKNKTYETLTLGLGEPTSWSFRNILILSYDT